MKKLLTITGMTLFSIAAAAFASPETDAIMAAEKGAWQAIKDKKWDAFDKLLAKDFRSVYASGVNNAEKEMAEVKTVDFKSFSLGEMEVTFITKDVALISYPVTLEGKQGDKDLSGKAYSASMWRKDGNDWRLVFHTDMKAD